MFTAKELHLISISLIALKDLAEVDLIMANEDGDDGFRQKVLAEVKETDALMAKVKSMM